MDDQANEPMEDPRRIVRLRQLSREHRIEVLTVILLSFTSLVATWSGFQSSRWNAEQTQLYSLATAARTESTRLSVLATQLEILDLEMFNVYAVAIASGNDQLAEFHRQRFRPDFLPAFEAWDTLDPFMNPAAPASPFLMPEYQLPESRASEVKAEDAAQAAARALEAATNSDAYILTTVFLGIVLFFLGISARLDLLAGRMTLIAFGVAILAFSLYRLLSLPRA